MRPVLAKALRRVWPERPMTSRFWPSGSMAKSLTMRSETFLEEEEEGVTAAEEEADDREIRDLEKKDREGRRWIWEESLWRFETAIVAKRNGKRGFGLGLLGCVVVNRYLGLFPTYFVLNVKKKKAKTYSILMFFRGEW